MTVRLLGPHRPGGEGAALPPSMVRLDSSHQPNPHVLLIQRQLTELEAHCRLHPATLRIDEPTPLNRVWMCDEHLKLTLSGFPCQYEDVSGALSVRCEHTFFVRYGKDYPRKSDLTFWAAWKEMGAVPFHPNLNPIYRIQPNRTAGYICLWADTPQGVTITQSLIQLVQLLTYRQVNRGEEHRLNPRAFQALERGELQPCDWILPFSSPMSLPHRPSTRIRIKQGGACES